MSILVSGSLAYDYVMNFPDSFRNHILPDQLHILNVCFMVDRLERSWGGTAGNIAYTMKLLGADPLILSAVGGDGNEYLEHFKKHGISAKYILQDKKQLTSSAHITTDADDNQITAFYNGPLELGLQINTRDIIQNEQPTLALISPTQKEVMEKHLKESAEAGIKTVFDPGQQITAFKEIELKKMINQAHFVIGNDYEIKLLEQRTGWDTKELLKQTKVLIITLGDKGSVVMTDAGERVEAGVCPPQSADDPTGAGDAYRAGFFVGFQLGYNWKTCAQMGATAAAYAVETFGTQTHRFTANEFCERYYNAFKEKISL